MFAAGRPENVVVADTLIFPSHQVSCHTDLSGLSANGGMMSHRMNWADGWQASPGLMHKRT